MANCTQIDEFAIAVALVTAARTESHTCAYRGCSSSPDSYYFYHGGSFSFSAFAFAPIVGMLAAKTLNPKLSYFCCGS